MTNVCTFPVTHLICYLSVLHLGRYYRACFSDEKNRDFEK